MHVSHWLCLVRIFWMIFCQKTLFAFQLKKKKYIFIIYLFFWPQIIFLPWAKVQIFQFRSIKNVQWVTAYCSFVCNYRHRPERQDSQGFKMPYSVLQLTRSRRWCVMQPHATWGDVIQFWLIQICINQSNSSLLKTASRRPLNNTACI